MPSIPDPHILWISIRRKWKRQRKKLHWCSGNIPRAMRWAANMTLWRLISISQFGKFRGKCIYRILIPVCLVLPISHFGLILYLQYLCHQRIAFRQFRRQIWPYGDSFLQWGSGDVSERPVDDSRFLGGGKGAGRDRRNPCCFQLIACRKKLIPALVCHFRRRQPCLLKQLFIIINIRNLLDFFNGEVAMFPNGPWMIPDFSEAEKAPEGFYDTARKSFLHDSGFPILPPSKGRFPSNPQESPNRWIPAADLSFPTP